MPFQILNICKNDYVRQNIKSFKQQIIQNICQNEKPPPPTRRWETGGGQAQTTVFPSSVQTRCSQIGVMAYITSIAIILYCFLRWQISLQMPAVSNAALQTWPLPAAECEAPEPILRRAIVCSAIKNTFWISTKEQAVQTHAQLVPGPVSLSGLQSSNQYFNENDASDGFRYTTLRSIEHTKSKASSLSLTWGYWPCSIWDAECLDLKGCLLPPQHKKYDERLQHYSSDKGLKKNHSKLQQKEARHACNWCSLHLQQSTVCSIDDRSAFLFQE